MPWGKSGFFSGWPRMKLRLMQSNAPGGFELISCSLRCCFVTERVVCKQVLTVGSVPTLFFGLVSVKDYKQ